LPVIERHESATTVLEGRTTEMMCTAGGRPTPTLSWRRAGPALSSNSSAAADYVTGIQPVISSVIR